jgi:hypothetical protein
MVDAFLGSTLQEAHQQGHPANAGFAESASPRLLPSSLTQSPYLLLMESRGLWHAHINPQVVSHSLSVYRHSFCQQPRFYA